MSMYSLACISYSPFQGLYDLKCYYVNANGYVNYDNVKEDHKKKAY